MFDNTAKNVYDRSTIEYIEDLWDGVAMDTRRFFDGSQVSFAGIT